MAQYANPQLTSYVMAWARDQTIKSGRMPNVLYLDYLGQYADDAVSVAAELNAKFG
jgi:hypothetical protein